MALIPSILIISFVAGLTLLTAYSAPTLDSACKANMVCISGEKPVPDIGPFPSAMYVTKGVKEELGRLLFCDHRLSDDDAYACAQCHLPTHGFAEPRTNPLGAHGRLASHRNTPTLYNIRYNVDFHRAPDTNVLTPMLMWDGRVPSGRAHLIGFPYTDPLVEQILLPIKGELEMRMTYEQIDKKFNNKWSNSPEDVMKRDKYATRFPEFERTMYRALFQKAGLVYPDKPGWIAPEQIYRAIAAFERSIVTDDSPFDSYVRRYVGHHPEGLPRTGQFEDLGIEGFKEDEWKGMLLFRSEARCILCHNGPNFTDNQFHNVGWPATLQGGHWKYRTWKSSDPKPAHPCLGPDSSEFELHDCGRHPVLVKHGGAASPLAKGAFKTPTLRNIVETWPYMHDGGILTDFNAVPLSEKAERSLNEVIDFFNNGGGEDNPYSDPAMKPLSLNGEQKAQLKSFLKALTSKPMDLAKEQLDATHCPWPARP